MPVFNDSNLETAYNNIYSQLQNSGGYTPISMPERTLDSITQELTPTLRPIYERAIQQRYGATKEQKAHIDVDAASRGIGMNTSTWVTDAKNRIMNSEASDIAGLEADYAAKLAGDALNQYNNYLGDKLALDQYNQKLAQALEGDAYGRTIQQLQAGLISPKGKGDGGKWYTALDGTKFKTKEEMEQHNLALDLLHLNIGASKTIDSAVHGNDKVTKNSIGGLNLHMGSLGPMSRR